MNGHEIWPQGFGRTTMPSNDPIPELKGETELDRYLELMAKLTPEEIKAAADRAKIRKKRLANRYE